MRRDTLGSQYPNTLRSTKCLALGRSVSVGRLFMKGLGSWLSAKGLSQDLKAARRRHHTPQHTGNAYEKQRISQLSRNVRD